MYVYGSKIYMYMYTYMYIWYIELQETDIQVINITGKLHLIYIVTKFDIYTAYIETYTWRFTPFLWESQERQITTINPSYFSNLQQHVNN